MMEKQKYLKKKKKKCWRNRNIKKMNNYKCRRGINIKKKLNVGEIEILIFFRNVGEIEIFRKRNGEIELFF